VASSWHHPTHTFASEWNDPTSDRLYVKLAGADDADFDKKFISLMVSDHEDDVALFAKEAEKAGDADVRAFAQAALAKLREHLNRARQIEASLKS
jgi:putative membrane protein